MAVSFTAIDFETANNYSDSACAVGLAKVVSGKVVDRTSWLIRPIGDHGYFEPGNIGIHGITPEMVANSDDWEAQLPQMLSYIEDDPLVAHNAGFDMAVLSRSCQSAKIAIPAVEYLCTVQLSRKVFSNLQSFRLTAVANWLGLADFKHHDPAEDAETCANIAIRAAESLAAENFWQLAELAGVNIKQTVQNSESDYLPNALQS